ncbi:MAG: hypothetical protein JNG82_00070 [Opitutaceae bacterium]|nr:hypothetical protein [Opitutaceae bacterium]
MRPAARIRAFSLIEVVIAVGLFAGSIVVIIGLLGTLSRQAADSADVLTAQRLPAAVRVELARLAGNGFDGLAAQIPVMAAPLDHGFALVADREAAEVQSPNVTPPAALIPADAQYFLVECWRFPAEPLAFTGAKAFLALHVRVSWPYRVPGALAPVPLAERSQTTFAVSLNR